MIIPLSRKDRFQSLVKTFADGAYKSSSLRLVLYPSELVRLQKEFPELNFDIINLYKTTSSKKYEVEITKS